MLIKVAPADSAEPVDLSAVLGYLAGYNIDEGAFARAVKTDNPRVISVIDNEIGVIKQHLAVIHM